VDYLLPSEKNRKVYNTTSLRCGGLLLESDEFIVTGPIIIPTSRGGYFMNIHKLHAALAMNIYKPAAPRDRPLIH